MAVALKTQLGTGLATTSGTTITITTTAAIAIGDFVVVRWASDNLSATTPTATCADGGNTYTVRSQGAVNATAAAGVAGGILTSLATVARPTGSTITVTLSGAVAHKAATATSFTGVADTVRSTAVSATGTATAASAPASGTVNVGDLVLGTIANETRGTITGDADTLNGTWSTIAVSRSATSGTDASCITVGGQYKVASAAGAQTYNVTAVAAEWWISCLVMQEGPPTWTGSPATVTVTATSGAWSVPSTESGAVKFDANGEYLQRTGVVDATSYTQACWVRLDTDRNSYGVIFGPATPSGTNINYLSVGEDGTTLEAGGSVGASLTIGTWYYVACVITAADCTLYWSTGGAFSSSATGPRAALSASSNLWVGDADHEFGNIGDSALRGSVAHARLWTGALTTTELQAEMRSATAVRTTDLWGSWPLATDGNDVSGNARHLTVNGSVSYVTGPTLPSASYAPSDTPGLIGWYDASTGATTSTWTPKAGYGPTLNVQGSVTLSTLNGLTAVNCGNMAGGFRGNLTTAVTGTALTAVVLVVGNAAMSGDGVSKRVFSLAEAGQQDWQFVTGGALIGKDATFPTGYRATQLGSGPAPVTDTNPHIVTSRFDGTNHTMYVDGVAGTSVGSTGSFNATWLGVGCQAQGAFNDAWSGLIAEVCYYDRALTTTELNSITSYMRAKWLPPVADDFNRADGALTTPWVVVGGTMAVVSNQAAATAANASSLARYNQTLADDQWAEADITVFPGVGNGNSMGPAVRVNAGGGAVYYANYDKDTQNLDVWRIDGSSNYARVVAVYSTVGLNGVFKCRVEAQGTTIRLYVNGTLVGTGTDSTVASGQAGLMGAVYGTVPTKPSADNFRGGDLPYVPVGGASPQTWTGTAGTVTVTATSAEWSVASVAVSILGTPASNATSAPPTPVTITVPAGTNRAMFVGVGLDTSTGTYTHTVSSDLDGAFTQVAILNPSASNQGIAVFAKVAPSVGTHTISTVTGYGNLTGVMAVCFAGVDQTTPVADVQTATGSSTSVSMTTAPATDEMVVDFLCINNAPTVTPGAGQTAQGATPVSVLGGCTWAMSTQSGTDGGVMSWTLGAANRFGAIAIVANSAAAVSTGPQTWTASAATVTVTATSGTWSRPSVGAQTWTDTDFINIMSGGDYENYFQYGDLGTPEVWDTSVPGEIKTTPYHAKGIALRLSPVAASVDQFSKVTVTNLGKDLTLSTHVSGVEAGDRFGYTAEWYASVPTVYIWREGVFFGGYNPTMPTGPGTLEWRVVEGVGTLYANGALLVTRSFTGDPLLTGTRQQIGVMNDAVITAAEGGDYTLALTWTGSPATVTVTATSGIWSRPTFGPQTWDGTPGTVTITATSGAWSVPNTGPWVDTTFVNINSGGDYETIFGNPSFQWRTGTPGQIQAPEVGQAVVSRRLDAATGAESQFVRITTPDLNARARLFTHAPVPYVEYWGYWAQWEDGYVRFYKDGEYFGDITASPTAPTGPGTMEWRVINGVGTFYMNGIALASRTFAAPLITGRPYQGFGAGSGPEIIITDATGGELATAKTWTGSPGTVTVTGTSSVWNGGGPQVWTRSDAVVTVAATSGLWSFVQPGGFRVGTSNVRALRLGTAPVTTAFLGTRRVWPPIPQTWTGTSATVGVNAASGFWYLPGMFVFYETFATGMSRWTPNRWRSFNWDTDSGGVNGHVFQCDAVAGVDGVLPPNDVAVYSNRLWVASGSQNYGDANVRGDVPFEFAGGGVLEVDLILDAPDSLKGWSYIYVTQDPYAHPQHSDYNGAGPPPKNGFAVRFNFGSYSVASVQHPAPVINVFNNYSESLEGAALGTGVATSRTDPTTIRMEFTHSHIDLFANGVPWGALDWTLPPAMTQGYVYLGAHNHASLKYRDLSSVNVVYTGVRFDGAPLPSTKTSRVPDSLVRHDRAVEGHAGTGMDIGYQFPATLTLPAVASGVTSARLVWSFWGDLTQPNPSAMRVSYQLNGGTVHPVALEPEAGATPIGPSAAGGYSGERNFSVPITVSELVTGNNTVVFTQTGMTSGYAPYLGNVQLVYST